MKIKYPVYQPRLGEEERKNVMDCLESNWISSKGKYVTSFEEEFAAYHNMSYGITVTNGTTGLHLAMLTLGIGPGDEVIVPTFTYIAPVNAIKYVGATPVFVDCDVDTWQMSLNDTKKKISQNTKAILAVHIYGHPCEMVALKALAVEHGLFLIEDCAEALGSRVGMQLTGTFSDISIFSFYGNKTLTTGEGGMLLTNDKTIADRASHFKGQGLAKHRQYWHDVIGYNFRMTNICAAIGLAQLRKLDVIIKEKLEIAETYKKFLGDTVLIHQQKPGFFHSYWMVTILMDSNEERENLRNQLSKAGIETRPTFYPVHTMPMYSQKYEKHINAESIGWRGINLPSYPGLTHEDIKFISDKIKEFLNG